MRKLLTWGAGLAVVLGLKLFQHGAGADDLGFILAPACALASLLSGDTFLREAGLGWVSHEHRFIVGASCAGVTFLIAAFAAFYFSFVSRFTGWRRRAAWLLASLAMAFAVATPANALRIVLAVRLYEMDALYGAIVTPGRLHLVMGCVVYGLALLLSFLALERGLFNGEWTERRAALAPLGWYLAVVLGIPLLRLAFIGDPRAFLENAVMVVSICLLLFAASLLFRRRVVGSSPCEAQDPHRR
jgi:exosortase K